MSNDIAIRIEGLGKRYRYGGAAPLGDTLRSDLTEWVRGLWPRRRPKLNHGATENAERTFVSTAASAVETASHPLSPSVTSVPSVVKNPSPSSLIPHHSSLKEIHEDRLAHDPSYFWALRDINLEVRQGEVVGIIGRNGAGKSTLLKILSRITPPTTGKITYNGRIASLLEVGTGFHRELTGRENIFLNGSILGMKRAEIAKKFDEIVAFAEVEKFIDTPVKFYSSGMYVRLAFAVAAHLEPEILVVDEVLAVGDANFQKKCLGKMGDVAKQGRTILFVSHNMGAMTQLCPRALILHQGSCIFDGASALAVSTYLAQMRSSNSAAVFPIDEQLAMQITAMEVRNIDQDRISSTPHNRSFTVVIKYRVTDWKPGGYVCLDVFSESEIRILWACDVNSVEQMTERRPAGEYVAEVTIPESILPPGRYAFTSAIFAPGRNCAFDVKDKAIGLDVTDGGSLLSNFGIKPHAATIIPLQWATMRIPSSLDNIATKNPCIIPFNKEKK